MPTRVSQIFGSYDLFAKAIPGTAFFIGIISLLPGQDIPSDAFQSTLLLTAFIVVFFIMGFIVGQAVHSFAVWVESRFYAFGKRLYYTIGILQPGVWEATIVENLEETPERPRALEDEGSNRLSILATVAKYPPKLYIPFILVCYQLLVPHRVLFNRKLKNELGGKEDPGLLYRNFSSTVLDNLVIDSVTKEDYGDIYTVIMSQQEFIGIGRSRQFQAIFSFCRSMWVTLLFFSAAYTGILLTDSSTIPIGFLNHTPLIVEILSTKASLMFAICWMVFLSLLFILGEKYYKQDFVEYVIADFVTINSDRLEDLGE